MPTTKWIKSDSQSFYKLLEQLPDRKDVPQRAVVQTPAVDFEASAWPAAAERAAHAQHLAYGPAVVFSMPTQPGQRPLSKADAEALQRAIADERYKRQQREAATFGDTASAPMTAAKRRELLGMTEMGREVLRREDAAATSSTPSGMSAAQRRELLAATPLGREVLARERMGKKR